MTLGKTAFRQPGEIISCIIAMHTTGAVKGGESHERLHLLNAWRETALYTERERAA
ncbi:MAG TPA: carboxymuconolactone decarboxylase family protein [Burkholderiales bacterium]|nr:carboxymuconolactone decarboxylase family protein [Burkholderiales bacterium]